MATFTYANITARLSWLGNTDAPAQAAIETMIDDAEEEFLDTFGTAPSAALLGDKRIIIAMVALRCITQYDADNRFAETISQNGIASTRPSAAEARAAVNRLVNKKKLDL